MDENEQFIYIYIYVCDYMCVCDKHDDDLAFLCNFKYLFPARTALNIIYISHKVDYNPMEISFNPIECHEMSRYAQLHFLQKVVEAEGGQRPPRL